ncbi:hypothetical protein GWI33_007180 [Rhynchophorus ferrugineus]|uniref:Uncharacterized protein n=1 Tax=Rhynchophorus ferrugineus TaxID=354439 RepID=A0A834IK89_RHYFE|nr:hypothetical protein GWI33_007180 [Rhynchophorus ferrugineus]
MGKSAVQVIQKLKLERVVGRKIAATSAPGDEEEEEEARERRTVTTKRTGSENCVSACLFSTTVHKSNAVK